MDCFNCTLLSWSEIETLSRDLAQKIEEAGFSPDYIVALARGGVVPARLLCDRLYVKNYAALKIDHWGVTASPDGKASLSQELALDLSGKKVLVVDDITDTGQSMLLALDHVRDRGAEEVKTATLIHLKNSSFVPDFYAQESSWAWFVFPWNFMEDLVNLLGKITEQGKNYFSKEQLVNELRFRFGLRVDSLSVEQALAQIEKLHLWSAPSVSDQSTTPSKGILSFSSIISHEPLPKVPIAVLGGSGFYSLLQDTQELKIETPYGAPSDNLSLGKLGGKEVLFLNRHGRSHNLPPHLINYKANLFALKSLGVKMVLSVTACGSLQPNIKPGDLVVPDQLIDRTSGRESTFFSDPWVTHVSLADPYCSYLSKLLADTGKNIGLSIHERGTLVVISGPRFSTRAESQWYTSMGGQVINMTGFPEAVLARELEMCYSVVALVTDYDAGVANTPGLEPVSFEEVGKVFAANLEKARKLMLAVVEKVDVTRDCDCQHMLKDARLY